jgi:hypothetical protein
MIDPPFPPHNDAGWIDGPRCRRDEPGDGRKDEASWFRPVVVCPSVRHPLDRRRASIPDHRSPTGLIPRPRSAAAPVRARRELPVVLLA